MTWSFRIFADKFVGSTILHYHQSWGTRTYSRGWGTVRSFVQVPDYIPGLKPLKSPNGDMGVDGMVSVIGHEIAELATNPFLNAWYSSGHGQDLSLKLEIADLCEGIYGTGGGGPYTGQLLNGEDGVAFNMNGIRWWFLVQWVWNRVVNYCSGPNALDQNSNTNTVGHRSIFAVDNTTY